MNAKFICGGGNSPMQFVEDFSMLCGQQKLRNHKDNFRYIRFENCEFQAYPHKLIGHFPYLIKLNLSSVAYKTVDRADFRMLKKSPCFESFDLSFNKIEQIDAAVFSDFKLLEELNIHHNRIKKLDPFAFDGVVNLTDLDLSHNELSEFTSLSSVPLLKMIKLDLSFNNITTLGNFSSMEHLESLNLSHNRLVNAFGDVFDVLRSLVKLNLSHNEIVDISDIARSIPSDLKELDLSFNNITTIGTDSVIILQNKVLLPGADRKSAIFARLNKLQSLDLSNNKITRIDFALFSSGFRMLQSLYLNGNLLEELTLHVNVLFPNLEHLAITNNIFNCSYLKDFISTINQTILEYTNTKNLSDLNVHGVICENTHNIMVNQLQSSNQSSMNLPSIIVLTVGIVLIILCLTFILVLMRREELFKNITGFRRSRNSDVCAIVRDDDVPSSDQSTPYNSLS